MFEWLRRLRQKARDIVLPNREERAPRNQEKVNLKPYTPSARVFLGQLAYLQLSQFELLTNELKFSPNTQYKAELSEAAAKSFEKYRGIARIMSSLGIDTTDAMDPFTERIQTFHSRTAGIDWFEAIIKVYLVAGFLDDFYRRLSVGLPADIRVDVERSLNDKTFEKFAKRILAESMRDDPQLASRLAVWGRRLMGDVLLEMRAAFDNRKLAGVAKDKTLTLEEERVVNLQAYSKLEPLVSELMAAHTMRMDALGLTA
ncbi:MAG: hypothetical protein RL719_672 [Actinomycetota bacterium]